MGASKLNSAGLALRPPSLCCIVLVLTLGTMPVLLLGVPRAQAALWDQANPARGQARRADQGLHPEEHNRVCAVHKPLLGLKQKWPVSSKHALFSLFPGSRSLHLPALGPSGLAFRFQHCCSLCSCRSPPSRPFMAS